MVLDTHATPKRQHVVGREVQAGTQVKTAPSGRLEEPRSKSYAPSHRVVGNLDYDWAMVAERSAPLEVRNRDCL
jgi:hypothetical protein